MRSRFLHELTTPEVEDYFRRSAEADGPAALLPVGCVEMHGPHQPIGTDTLVAKAAALKIAEIADAIVLPEIHYTWAGSTDGFAGTISIPPEMARELVECVARRALAGGFARLAIISIHAPNRMVMGLAARRLFEQLGKPVPYIDAYEPVGKEAADLFAGDYRQGKEASLVLAAMQTLGLGELYDEKDAAVDDAAPAFPASFHALRPTIVGYYMQDPRQHACPSSLISTERGMRFLDLQAAAYGDIFKRIGDYEKDVQSQANRGF
jgi:creatinine amidohydrolase